jgi:multiple RNA-binding domain-containing protein 1
MAELKVGLSQEGVDVEAFKTASKKERSSTIILVKNIPHSTEENELREIFSKFGDIVRVRI